MAPTATFHGITSVPAMCAKIQRLQDGSELTDGLEQVVGARQRRGPDRAQQFVATDRTVTVLQQAGQQSSSPRT